MPISRNAASLQDVCLSVYLAYLETECHTWVSLKRSGSLLLEAASRNILPTLRKQLSDCMCGTSSTVLRGMMMKQIMSGKFPSKKYRNVVHKEYDDSEDWTPSVNLSHPTTEKTQQFIKKIRGRTAKCVNICCNGAFIVEIMLTVVINDEIRELVFEPYELENIWNRGGIGDFVPFNYPALLASYVEALINDTPKDPEDPTGATLARPPALEKLKIGRFELLLSKHKSWKVLQSHNVTKEYLNFVKYVGPEWSWNCDIWGSKHAPVNACKWQWPGMDSKGYLPNAQHAMYSVTSMFSYGIIYEKLAEICLSSDFVTNFCEQEGTPLFSAIGHGAPNLKILDLSGLIRLRGESILYLFFHDAFQSVHETMYLGPYKSVDNLITFEPIKSAAPIRRHSFERYCPWCLDIGAQNLLRAGCEFNNVAFSVIDDQIWSWIEENEMSLDLIKFSLMFSVSSSDLFNSVSRRRRVLRREQAFEANIPEEGMEEKEEFDGCDKWYPPKIINYDYASNENGDNSVDLIENDTHEYISVEGEDSSCLPQQLNPVASSIEVLRLPGRSLTGEMVPFLLKACPKLKTLGHSGSIPYGLRLLSDMGVKDLEISLEEIHIDFDMLEDSDWKDSPDYDERFGSSGTISNNSPNINFLPHNLHQQIFEPASECEEFETIAIKGFARRLYKYALSLAPQKDIETRISSYVDLIVKYIKNLKKLSVILKGCFKDKLPNNTSAWSKLTTLKTLVDLELKYNKFVDVAALIETLGKQLKKVTVISIPAQLDIPDLMDMLDGIQITETQYALIICESCPNLEYLECNSLNSNFHFDRPLNMGEGHFANLRHLKVCYITIETFRQLWAIVPLLENLKLAGIVESPLLNSMTIWRLTKADIDELLSSNSMSNLKFFFSGKLLVESFMVAKFLIDQLDSIQAIGQVTIPDDSLDDFFWEFKDFVDTVKVEKGTIIDWENCFEDEENDDE